jgi:hypothetical protein
MTQDARRPLHRLTPLHDDPAAAWLTADQRVSVAMTGVFYWFLFVIFLAVVFLVQAALLARTIVFFNLRLPFVGMLMVAVAAFWPMRRLVLRRKAAKVAALVRESTPSLGVPVDDFNELEQHPDGTAVSLVGWIRARGKLPERVGGEPCVGIALACHQNYPGVLETLNDFELCDEAGRTVPIQVAGARLLGKTNVNLTDANERRLVIASLNLPVGAVATGWDALVLRDGDPIMAVGFKQTALDPTQASLRAPAARAAVVSLASKPLLIFPIPGERRPRTSSLFDLS